MNSSIMAIVVACLVSPGDDLRDQHEPVTPLDELAGDYLVGPGIGTVYSLKITRAGRFEFESSGCLGVYVNRGEAEFVDGHLILEPRLLDPSRVRLFLHNLSEDFLARLSSLAREDAPDSARNLLLFVRALPEYALTLLSDGTPTDFIPIRWGERLYLVPKDGGPDFCNSFNQGHLTRFPGSGF